ncbi:MAG: BON domain-containing protein [Burkholderiaceae bacterium]|nr:BON domain-containing protein [Burkholderiaceae bacterium]
MKLLRQSTIGALVLAATTLAACGEKGSDTREVAQKGDQTAQNTLQQAANEVGKTEKSAMAAIDDAAITAKVKAAIVAEPALNGTDIKVSTTDGVVTLVGVAEDQQKIIKAQQLAQTVDGVKSVNNALVVKAPA